MKPGLDELYLALHTDLVPQDLVNVVFDDLLDDWFHIACACTDSAFLIGDLADDTRVDGRGRIALAHEDLSTSPSRLRRGEDPEEVRQALIDRLDALDFDQEDSLTISLVGAVPSGFRTDCGGPRRPRLAPSFEFRPGESRFELTFFDPDWIVERQDLDELNERLQKLVETIGERRTKQIEFETDGRFLTEEDLWHLHFAELPLAARDFR